MAWDDVLQDLTGIDDDRLGTAHGEVLARIQELAPKVKDRSLTDDELTELTSLRQNLDQMGAERDGRNQRREEAYAAADAAVADIPEPGTEQQPAEEPEPTEEPSESDTPAEAPAEDDTTSDTEADMNAAQPVAAGAKVPALGKTSKAAPAKTKTAGTQASIAIVAAADLQDRGAGTPLQFDEIGRAMANRLQALRASSAGGDGEQVSVVKMVASGVPEERHVRESDHWGRNTAKFDAVASPGAIVAAGGLCAPLAIDYSYQAIGVQGRPIRDSLPAFQAERGGIQFRPDISPVTNTSNTGPRSATGIWTNQNDVDAYAASNPPRKAVWIVDCPDTATAQVEAITLQLEFSNVTSRFDPETVQANQHAALVWHDRFAENNLLAKLQAASKVMTSEQVLGATRDVLVTLDRAQSYYRSVHRLGDNISLRAILPFWVRHMLRADLTRAMSMTPTEGLAITDEQIDSFLRSRGLNPVWHLDGKDTDTAAVTGPPAIPAIPAQQYTLASVGASVPKHPTTIDMLLHAEGHFTFLDGGTLDLGIVRDSALIDRNRYRQFTETWEGVAARGVEALRLLASVAPTGESAGTIDVATNA